MKIFLRYLALGLLGLTLSLSFPRLPVDWSAIVLSLAFLRSESKGYAWILLFVMAGLYSAFSISAPWAIALPLVLAALFFYALRRNFSFTPLASQVFLLSGFWLTPFIFWSARSALRGGGWLPSWHDALGLGLTLFFGLGIMPVLAGLAGELRCRLRFFGGRPERVDLSRADWLSARGGRIPRKPFGLEKGL